MEGKKELKAEGKYLVLYDGFCKLCSGWVQWIIRRDRMRRITFMPLQQAALQEPDLTDRDAVVLRIGEKQYEGSEAVLRIALRLSFPWPLMGIFFLLPSFLREGMYRVLARNRLKWFGERDSCHLPTCVL